MSEPFAEALLSSLSHYLEQAEHLLRRLAEEERAKDLLSFRLAPDMFDTGLNFAVALQFAARAICPPSGLEVPEIPDEFTPESLLDYKNDVASILGTVSASDLARTIRHRAGKADLNQEPADYIAQFALPNMIFHLSIAYAGLRHEGVKIGKADFDGLHRY